MEPELDSAKAGICPPIRVGHLGHLDSGSLRFCSQGAGLLWLFGEKGVQYILLPSESDFAEARRLFPEAQIDRVPEWMWQGEYLRRADRSQ